MSNKLLSLAGIHISRDVSDDGEPGRLAVDIDVLTVIQVVLVIIALVQFLQSSVRLIKCARRRKADEE
ncbi:MAG: hypothetical protein LBN02_05745 [Oscillospiraceae bacterium]|jgi:hypothetical protein|nr:hypothetical protein [Oscillospiraceae bacterium]